MQKALREEPRAPRPAPQFPRTPCPAAELGLCGNRRETGEASRLGGPRRSRAGAGGSHVTWPSPRPGTPWSARADRCPPWVTEPASRRAALARPPPLPSLSASDLVLGTGPPWTAGAWIGADGPRSLGDMPGLEPTCQDSVGLSPPLALKLPAFPGAWRPRGLRTRGRVLPAVWGSCRGPPSEGGRPLPPVTRVGGRGDGEGAHGALNEGPGPSA